MRTYLLIPFIFFACRVSAQSDTIKQSQSGAIKFDLFSPLTGCFGLLWEFPPVNAHSAEVSIGFIGVRWSERFINEKFTGAYVSSGMRFYFNNTKGALKDYPFIINNGTYIKPEIILNYFTYLNDAGKDTEGKDLSLALLLSAGNQWKISDKIIIDIWAGLGYDKSWINEQYNGKPSERINYYSYKYNYFHLINGPVVLDTGINIGILLF